MMNINQWYSQYAKKPMIALALAIFFLQATYLVFAIQEQTVRFHAAMDNLTNVVNVALNQNNRTLIESVMYIASTQLGVEEMLLCDKDNALLSIPVPTAKCEISKTSFLSMQNEFPIPGFASMRMITKSPALKMSAPAFIATALTVLLTLLSIALVAFISKRFSKEIFDPIRTDFLDLSTNRIVEFYDLQARRNATIRLREVEAISNLAVQVSHDIRSPLSALNLVIGTLQDLPEEKRLVVRSATRRINDIANHLLQKGKSGKRSSKLPEIAAEPVMLIPLLESIISEKRAQYSDRTGIEIQNDFKQGYGLFASINGSELARAISNLINNSVEAFDGSGRVIVRLTTNHQRAQILIEDNGKGIPPQIISQLGEQGVSHGKEDSQSGSGLGLFHARHLLESVNGKFTITSQLGAGTRVALDIPLSSPPTWFLEKVTVASMSTIVSLDHDQTIHQIWNGRLKSAFSSDINVLHLTFSSIDTFDRWFAENSKTSLIFLVAFEFLGQKTNGLDIVERLGLASSSILVTSSVDDKFIRTRAESLGVKILPKALAPFVPIEVEVPLVKYDAVLIDDDLLVQMTWKMAAEERGKNIACFTTLDEFLGQAQKIDLSTPLFIDVSLGNGVRGDVAAEKAASLGFTEIALATGYATEDLKLPACVKRVITKDPAI